METFIGFINFWLEIFITFLKFLGYLICTSLFCYIFCKWESRPEKPNPNPSFSELENALIHEKDDDKVIKLFSHYNKLTIKEVRKIHKLVSKRDNPSVLAKLQEADHNPIL